MEDIGIHIERISSKEYIASCAALNVKATGTSELLAAIEAKRLCLEAIQHRIATETNHHIKARLIEAQREFDNDGPEAVEDKKLDALIMADKQADEISEDEYGMLKSLGLIESPFQLPEMRKLKGHPSLAIDINGNIYGYSRKTRRKYGITRKGMWVVSGYQRYIEDLAAEFRLAWPNVLVPEKIRSPNTDIFPMLYKAKK